MNAIKCILRLAQGRVDFNTDPPAAGEPGGWTEVFYMTGVDIDESHHVAAVALIEKRAALLSKQGAVEGYTLIELSAASDERTISIDNHKPGSTNEDCDDPGNALKWRVRSKDTSNAHIVTIRGVPDARTEGGRYKASGPYKKRIQEFFAVITKSPFRFRGTDFNTAGSDIIEINADGVAKLKDLVVVAVDAEVTVLRTVAAGHRQKGGTFIVPLGNSLKVVTLADWKFGASKGGYLRLVGEDLLYENSISEREIDRPKAGHRDTGGPTRKSRGRRSARYK